MPDATDEVIKYILAEIDPPGLEEVLISDKIGMFSRICVG
jgi:hypothetical protein